MRSSLVWMRSSRVGRWDLAEWLDRLTANAKVATGLGSTPASSDTAETERRQMKQCLINSFLIKSKINYANTSKRYRDIPLCTKGKIYCARHIGLMQYS
jgi:hypothetical protein